MRCLFAAIIFFSSFSATLAQSRVALVVGNSAYAHAGELKNPRNDAEDLAAALRRLKFEVLEGYDLDKSGLEKKIREFASALKSSSVGVFFYAGHGLQVAGKNYIVPVDAALSTPEALDFEMVRLDLVQRVMESATKTNVLFLDACRNNPLARNLARAMGTRSVEIGRGLAPVESGIGTLVSFSTQPGNVALDGAERNSPFAAALLRHINQPGQDLNSVLISVRNDVMTATSQKQVPWEHSALRARFYFNGGEVAPQVDVSPSPPPQQTSKVKRTTATKQQCGAIAISDGKHTGAGSGPTQEQAKRSAMEMCVGAGGLNCRVTTSGCL